MNEIQIFNYNNTQVRTIEMNGEPWFVLKDVCEILGISKYRDAAARLDEDERGSVRLDTLGGKQEMTAINESGLYNVILRSDKPEAKPFRKWVTSEVLPAIRKTGSYSTAAKPSKALEIKEINAKVRLSNQFLKLSKVDTLSAEYKNILVSKAAEILTGTQIIPLPKSQQKMYSATEIGKMFGLSANKIGRIANEHGLKTTEYGEYYRSKAEHSVKEVDSFVYNDRAVEKFKGILGKSDKTKGANI